MPREIVAANEFSKLDVAWGWDPATQWAATVSVESADGKTGATVGLDWGDLERLNRAVRRAMKHHRKAIVE